MRNLSVSRYCNRQQPDRLCIEEDGKVILDISMSGDSPLQGHLDGNQPWFFTGSPYGQEILDFIADIEGNENG